MERAVLKETVQHPLTILPAAVSLVSLLFMGAIHLDLTSFSVGFGAALLGASSWVVNYFFRGETFAAAHIAKLRELRDAQKRDRFAALNNDCRTTHFEAGVKAARDLNAAYETLCAFLTARGESGSLNAMRFLVLAEDTYQEGLRIIRAALDTHQALQQIEATQLRQENQKLQQQINAGKQSAPTRSLGSQHEMWQATIEGNQKLIDLYDRQSQQLDKLLAQSKVLETALETAYLEAIELAHDSESVVNGQAASKLESAIAAARKVEDRLKALGDTNQQDQLYLQSGAVAKPRAHT